MSLASSSASRVAAHVRRSLLAAAVAACVLRAYLRTAAASIPGGDSGELVAEACQLGVAHPPGYPLFVYLARLAIVALPHSLGPPIRRVNLASCGLATVTAVMVAEVGRRMGRRTVAALFGAAVAATAAPAVEAAAAAAAVAWALSPHVWLHAVGAEVFALNNALVAALLLLCVTFADAADAAGAEVRGGAATGSASDHSSAMHRLTLGGAVLGGLALSNQHTAVLTLLPIVAWVAATQARLLTPRRACEVVAATALGLSPYLHLPLAHALWRGPGSWGDATTLAGFARHVSRADYGTFRLMARSDPAAEGGVARTARYVRDLLTAQAPHAGGAVVLLLLGVAACAAAALAASSPPPSRPSSGKLAAADARGVLHAARVARTLPALLPAALALYLAVFHGLSNMPLDDPLLFGVHARFWQQPNLLAFALMGVGGSAAAGAVVAAARTHSSFVVAGAVAGAVAALGGAAVAAQLTRGGAALAVQPRNHVLERYGRALLEPLPPRATLVTGYDMQWTAARYLQACEGVRTDVALLNSAVLSFPWFAAARGGYPHVSFPGTHYVCHLTPPHAAGGFSLADFFAANIALDGGAALVASYDASPPHPDFHPRDFAHITGGGNRSRGVASEDASSAPLTPPPRGGVFFTGAPLFRDSAHAEQFELVPFGIVERVVPRRVGAERRLTTWRNLTRVSAVDDAPHRRGALRLAGSAEAEADVDMTRAAWAAASAAFDGHVPLSEYDGGTWEHATRVDYWAKAAGYAAWLLEWALLPSDGKGRGKVGGAMAGGEAEPRDVCALLEAAALLEDALRVDREDSAAAAAPDITPGSPPPTALKNLGLAYVRLVRSSASSLRHCSVWPAIEGAAAATERRDESALRTAAARRVLDVWGVWLGSPDARADPGHASIAHVVAVLRGVVDGTVGV